MKIQTLKTKQEILKLIKNKEQKLFKAYHDTDIKARFEKNPDLRNILEERANEKGREWISLYELVREIMEE